MDNFLPEFVHNLNLELIGNFSQMWLVLLDNLRVACAIVQLLGKLRLRKVVIRIIRVCDLTLSRRAEFKRVLEHMVIESLGRVILCVREVFVKHLVDVQTVDHDCASFGLLTAMVSCAYPRSD